MSEPAIDGRELSQAELLNYATDVLANMLGSGWQVGQHRPALDRGIDVIWRITGPDHGRTAVVLVEAKRQLTPVMVTRDLVPQFERYRKLVDERATAMVVSPWLSPRTRQVLDEEEISYLDTTGNVSLRTSEPAVFIRTEGAQRDPRPRAQVRRGISGPRAGRVVRHLVDFKPPRRAAELAKASKISESYASRLLETLSDEALIQRKNSVITKVDWQNLLRARAESYQLMKANHVVAAVARRGVEATLETLRLDKTRHPVLMTGVVAANGYVPLVVGGGLMLYVPPGPHVVDEVMKDLGLLRAPHGATAGVQLLQPMSDGAFDRPAEQPVDGVPTVGLSQLVLDCLSGPGRMPAAGEALITWMEGHEDSWRRRTPLIDDPADPLS